MKMSSTSRLLVLLSILLAQVSLTQELPKIIEQEESAEVFLEEYTDEFQETFFEALKQKGIQNYDRASNLLLKCKQLEPDNFAVDHELAKTNLLDKKYASAQEFAVEALISEPENYWFLNTLHAILKVQGNDISTVRQSIPYDNKTLRYNLALIQFKARQFDAAAETLKGLDKNDSLQMLERRILDSIEKNTQSFTFEVDNTAPADPLAFLKQQLELQIKASNFLLLQAKAAEAVEEYPLQPFFYYAQGLALNRQNKHRAAVEILESGLEYVFDDRELSKKFYTELATAYTALGNSVKANEYLRKSKFGL